MTHALLGLAASFLALGATSSFAVEIPFTNHVAPAGGEPVDDAFHFSLFGMEADFSTTCGTFTPPSTCTELSSPPGQPGLAFVWVMATRVGGYPDGLGAVEFGIRYDGLDVVAGTPCDQSIPSDSWPDSGSWVAVAFSCAEPQGETWTVAQFLIAEGNAGVMMVDRLTDTLGGTPRDDDPAWVNCDAAPVYSVCPENLDMLDLAIGGAGECPSCRGGTPILESTWGGIKSAF